MTRRNQILLVFGATLSSLGSALFTSLALDRRLPNSLVSLLLYLPPGLLFGGLVVVPWTRFMAQPRSYSAGALAVTVVAYPGALQALDFHLGGNADMWLAGLVGAAIVSFSARPIRPIHVPQLAATGFFATLLSTTLAAWIPRGFPAQLATFLTWQVAVAIWFSRRPKRESDPDRRGYA